MKVLSLDIEEGSVAVYNDIIYLGYRRQISANIREEKEKTKIQNFPTHNQQDRILSYIPGERTFKIITFSPHPEESGSLHSISLSCNGISKLHALPDGHSIILEDLNKTIYLLQITNESPSHFNLQSFSIQKQASQTFSYDLCVLSSHQFILSNPQSILIESQEDYQSPEIDFYQYERKGNENHENMKVKNSFFLPQSNFVVHLFVQSELGHQSPILLQIVDIQRKNYKWIEIPSDLQHLKFQRGEISNFIDFVPSIWISELSNGKMVVMEENGRLRVLEISSTHLDSSFKEWKKLLGSASHLDHQDLKMTIEYEGERDVGAPNEGKPTDGKEHHGGNTWQEGTGGVDTVGLFSPFSFVCFSLFFNFVFL